MERKSIFVQLPVKGKTIKCFVHTAGPKVIYVYSLEIFCTDDCFSLFLYSCMYLMQKDLTVVGMFICHSSYLHFFSACCCCCREGKNKEFRRTASPTFNGKHITFFKNLFTVKSVM